MRGPTTVAGEVRDRADGTYGASFTVNISGSYALHVTLERQHVRGSPFELLVDADPVRLPSAHRVRTSRPVTASAVQAAFVEESSQQKQTRCRTKGPRERIL